MARCDILRKNPVNIAHLPTLLLVVGYPFVWAEMLSGAARSGVTSPAASIIFLFFVGFILVREWQAIAAFLSRCRAGFERQGPTAKIFWTFAGLISCFLLLRVFLESLLPPHLMQESDAMNYHLSMPRQHLITGSFAHIPWSADDLFFLTLDFALAPFWFVSALPNKFPQFIFFLGLLGVVFSLSRQLKGSVTASMLAVLALLGSHGHGIQMGSAMLDLTVCYLFLAALDSFLRRQKWLFIIEFTFFVWAKSLVLLQVAALILVLGIIYLVMKKMGGKTVSLDFEQPVSAADRKQYASFFRETAGWILLVSAFVAGPFMAKSLYYAGTPFFPVGVGTFAHPGIKEGSLQWTSLVASADYMTHTVSHEAFGRSVVDFLRHLWIIAVPEESVNNTFDYPLGLTYLIFLGPFLFFLGRSVRNKEFVLLPWLVVAYWMLWWLSMRETRFLYAPVVLMFIVVASQLKRPSKILMSVLLAALLFNTVSVSRASKVYVGPAGAILRSEDRKLVDISRQYLKDGRSDAVEVESTEVAYAQFPAVYRKENLPHAIAF